MEIGKGATKLPDLRILYTIDRYVGEVKVDNNGGPKNRASESPLKYCSIR